MGSKGRRIRVRYGRHTHSQADLTFHQCVLVRGRRSCQHPKLGPDLVQLLLFHLPIAETPGSVKLRATVEWNLTLHITPASKGPLEGSLAPGLWGHETANKASLMVTMQAHFFLSVPTSLMGANPYFLAHYRRRSGLTAGPGASKELLGSKVWFHADLEALVYSRPIMHPSTSPWPPTTTGR